ncbi:MAG TPA: tetratricopeptide repeat protein [Fibrobacteria bacterium]|nr:tetratricopeptide repeat protein [Fibrobacteria bacterium]
MNFSTLTRKSFQAIALAAMLLAFPAGSNAAAVNPPGTFTKILRVFGLQSPPGSRGDKAYRKGNYEEAVRQYGRATEETDSVPPLLDRNLGNALYRQKRYAEAADYYGRALKKSGADSALAASAHYNLGNALYRKAEGADSTQAQSAMADLREALAHYKKALRLGRAKGDKALEQDARRNLEITDARLRKLLDDQKKNPPPQKPGDPPPPPEPSARAKEALARALQLAQERRYDEAAAVLDDILKTDKSASSFSSHRKRLDDVMKILRGETPSDPTPRDPRIAPWNPGPPGGRGTP